MAYDHVITINREIPQELLSAARGGKIKLTMEDRRSEDYKPKMWHSLGKATHWESV